MKSAFALLALTTALGTSIVGALSAAPITAPDSMSSGCAVSPAAACQARVDGLPLATTGAPLILADNDGDDDDGGWFFMRKERHEERHENRERGDDDDDDEDDDDGYSCMPGQPGCATGNAPAPAGSVAPPKNGLFAPGAAPAVQVN